ncbi:MAG: crotonase/enoyl-CoA hydratase family protein [Pseudomonadota bacterium]
MPDPAGPAILTERRDATLVVTLNRPHRRNAVDRDTAFALYEAFRTFDADDGLSVAVLTGAGGTFCAGADLQALSAGQGNAVEPDGDLGPMGPTRLRLSKPVIAAVEGHAVAGGLELALWCDLRVASRSAVFGVFCRRFGVPMIDGGSVRLPRLIGQSRAMDMFLTGRPVEADEALAFGLANRVVPEGETLDAALRLAADIAAFPQTCLRGDRRSLMEQWGMGEWDALMNEVALGLETIRSGETRAGATRFKSGEGRGGSFER